VRKDVGGGGQVKKGKTGKEKGARGIRIGAVRSPKRLTPRQGNDPKRKTEETGRGIR